MSAKPYTLTLEFMKSLCTMDAEGCWIWGMSKAQDGTPHMQHAGKQITPARVAWKLAHGRKPPPFLLRTCGKRSCINPECMEGHTRKTWFKALERVGRMPGKARMSAVQRIRSQRDAKLDWDKVRAVRASEESARLLAEQLGVTKGLIYQIRRQEVWKEGLFA